MYYENCLSFFQYKTLFLAFVSFKQYNKESEGFSFFIYYFCLNGLSISLNSNQ